MSAIKLLKKEFPEEFKKYGAIYLGKLEDFFGLEDESKFGKLYRMGDKFYFIYNPTKEGRKPQIVVRKIISIAVSEPI